MRLCNVLGNTDEKVSAKKNALQFLIQKLKNNEDIELYDSGNFYRDYMHVDDVVSAINLVINKGNTNEIFNIGFGEPVLFKLIIDYAKDKINSKSNIIAIPPKEFHSKIQVKSMYMDNSKIKKLGFTATKNIFETIDTLI
jgi:nucleoside-diphosphate-sugar epimerase